MFGISSLGITGNVVMETPTQGQIAIQELLRSTEFKQIGDGAKICINVISNNDVYGYKVRKNGDLFRVSQSDRYCEGAVKEDIVVTFESYGALLNAKVMDDLEFFKLPAINEDFNIWESRFVRTGGLIKQNEEFTEKYCKFLNSNFKSNLKEWGIDCSITQDSPSIISTFFTKYWWILLIILFTVAVSFVTISMFKDDSDDSIEEETLEQLHDYIEKSRKAGIGDYKIKEALLDSGWDSMTVKLAFEKVRKHHLSSLFDRFEKIIELPFLSKSEESQIDEDDEFDF